VPVPSMSVRKCRAAAMVASLGPVLSGWAFGCSSSSAPAVSGGGDASTEAATDGAQAQGGDGGGDGSTGATDSGLASDAPRTDDSPEFAPGTACVPATDASAAYYGMCGGFSCVEGCECKADNCLCVGSQGTAPACNCGNILCDPGCTCMSAAASACECSGDAGSE